jgi:sugar lactone lactonase YvrE
MRARVHAPHRCQLGEGPLWHPERGQLFWFDILGKQLHCDDGRSWRFEHHVSAAGWVSRDALLIASEVALFRFDIETGAQAHICALEADNQITRSNDGRADPWGGFWIGTMGKAAEPDAGAIYRYYKGTLRQLFAPVTISNAIAFAPDRSCAYWADTALGTVFRVTLDPEGWPAGAPETYLDLGQEGLNPDGAIVLADGSYLNAQWGAARVARYGADGTFLEAFALPTPHVTCPAMGGPDLTTLFATSAQQGLSAAQLAQDVHAGQTFATQTTLKGLPEYQVIL